MTRRWIARQNSARSGRAFFILTGLATFLCGASAIAAPASEHKAKTETSIQQRHRNEDARRSVEFQNLLGARVAPLGTIDQFRVGYRNQLYRSNALLMSQNFIAARAEINFTPSYVAPGIRLELQPLSILQVGASFHRHDFFGTLGNVQSFSDAGQSHSPEMLLQRQDDQQNYATSGHSWTVFGILQARWKSWIAKTQMDAKYFDLDLRRGDEVFFDRIYDTVLDDAGWVYLIQSDVLWSHRDRIFVGLHHSAILPQFRDDATLVRNVDEKRNRIQRLGPMFAMRWMTSRAHLKSWTAFAQVQWHLEHRYRAGQVSSPAIPMVLMGFHVAGVIWQSSE